MSFSVPPVYLQGGILNQSHREAVEFMAKLREVDPQGQCYRCSPDFPPRWEKNIPDLDEIAVAWGDIHYRVYLDGVDVSNRTVHARRGDPGWVVQYVEIDGKLYRCPCGKGVPEVVMTGVVEFERM